MCYSCNCNHILYNLQTQTQLTLYLNLFGRYRPDSNAVRPLTVRHRFKKTASWIDLWDIDWIIYLRLDAYPSVKSGTPWPETIHISNSPSGNSLQIDMTIITYLIFVLLTESRNSGPSMLYAILFWSVILFNEWERTDQNITLSSDLRLMIRQ